MAAHLRRSAFAPPAPAVLDAKLQSRARSSAPRTAGLLCATAVCECCAAIGLCLVLYQRSPYRSFKNSIDARRVSNTLAHAHTQTTTGPGP
jgi:hypothetical protein